jgi:hypothetical protein
LQAQSLFEARAARYGEWSALVSSIARLGGPQVPRHAGASSERDLRYPLSGRPSVS